MKYKADLELLDRLRYYWELLRKFNPVNIDNSKPFFREQRAILNAFKHHGLFIYVITGPQGSGKSSLALHILDNLYKNIIDDPVERADIVMGHVFFDPLEAYEYFKHMHGYERYPVMVFDDAGVWFSSLMFWLDRARYSLLHGLWQLARSHTNGLIMTLPTLASLPKSLRHSTFYYVRVIKEAPTMTAPWRRHVRVYLRTYTFERPRHSIKYDIHIRDIRLPPELYSRYMHKRRKFMEDWEKFVMKAKRARAGFDAAEASPGQEQMPQLDSKIFAELEEQPSE